MKYQDIVSTMLLTASLLAPAYPAMAQTAQGKSPAAIQDEAHRAESLLQRAGAPPIT